MARFWKYIESRVNRISWQIECEGGRVYKNRGANIPRFLAQATSKMQLSGDIGLSEGYEDQEFSFGHAEFEVTYLCEMYEAKALGNRLKF